MIEDFFPNPVVSQRLHAGALSACIDGVVQEMSDRGFAAPTAKYAIRLLAHLDTWLQRRALGIAQLDESTVDAFLQDRYRSRRKNRSDRPTLVRLLTHLREAAVVAPLVPDVETDAHASIKQTFQEHLISQRDLAPSTVRSYLDTVGRFLEWRFGTHSPELAALCAQEVSAFMLAQARRYSARHTQRIASALRGFLRFLLESGAIATDLAQYVPAPACRHLSGLPKFMPGEDVERLLQSIDRARPQGLRDYAIVLLLARLGLRATKEVAALRLEDLDWDAGEVVIRGKGGRLERLPLPCEVGEAFSRYLRDARAPCPTRQVFVCLRAPRRGLRNGNAIGTIVRRALSRADLHPPHQGAHLLRHSLATRLLRNGASLAEIGELLRHRHLDTTQIYAKVDERSLRTLAPAWPGGGR